MRGEGRWAFAIAGYFALQLILRLLIGEGLDLDEAEAFYHARHLAWGYGPQPPLYFWLQWAAFRVLGEGLLALGLLKAGLLAGTLVIVLRVLHRDMPLGPAVAATLSLSMLPQVVWESQRALTHSVLALFMAALVTLAALRMLERGGWRDHLALGVALGLGALSKFNFVLWPAGLLVAALVLPDVRARLRPGRLAVAAAVAAAIAAPAAMWIARHPALGTGSVGKLEIEAVGGLAARLEGSQSFLAALLSFHALAILVVGGFAAARGRGAWSGGPLPQHLRLLGAASLASLGMVWLGLALSGATEVKDRWLLPLAWPLVAVAVAALWPGLPDRARRGLGWIAGGLWLLAAAALPYASLVDPGYRGGDYRPLADRLRALAGDETPVIVGSPTIAGNLVFREPDLAPIAWEAGTDLPRGRLLLVLADQQPPADLGVGPGRIVSIETFDPGPGREVGPLTLFQLR